MSERAGIAGPLLFGLLVLDAAPLRRLGYAWRASIFRSGIASAPEHPIIVQSTTPPSPGAEPTRAEIAALAGPAVLEFGASWCGHCKAAQPLIAAAWAGHGGVRRIVIEDGPGRRLGRAYRVTLWPTLVFLRDGAEVARLVRPADAAEIARALALIDPA